MFTFYSLANTQPFFIYKKKKANQAWELEADCEKNWKVKLLTFKRQTFYEFFGMVKGFVFFFFLWSLHSFL